MKTLLPCLAALAVFAPSICVGAEQAKLKAGARAAKAEFEQHGSDRHKWKKGQAHPESLTEAGLLADATLVWDGLYFDGGTKGYLFRDSAGNFLAVCTGPGLQSKDHPRRIDADAGSRLFLGALHYANDGAEMVPAGSKAEAWLRTLIEEKKG